RRHGRSQHRDLPRRIVRCLGERYDVLDRLGRQWRHEPGRRELDRRQRHRRDRHL
ncbi:MAG: hypothetical protein AVDCRST_MAG85-3546, partial [uncultured Solirubrobacteraceae bacterium]